MPYGAHNVLYTYYTTLWTSMLYPQHLDVIWTGPTQYKLTYDTLQCCHWGFSKYKTIT